MTAEFLWINIPLMTVAFTLWVGTPVWLGLWHPDRDPRETRTVPAYLRERTADREEARELVMAGNR